MWAVGRASALRIDAHPTSLNAAGVSLIPRPKLANLGGSTVPDHSQDNYKLACLQNSVLLRLQWTVVLFCLLPQFDTLSLVKLYSAMFIATCDVEVGRLFPHTSFPSRARGAVHPAVQGLHPLMNHKAWYCIEKQSSMLFIAVHLTSSAGRQSVSASERHLSMNDWVDRWPADLMSPRICDSMSTKRRQLVAHVCNQLFGRQSSTSVRVK